MGAAIPLNHHLFMQRIIEAIQMDELLLAQEVAFAHSSSFLNLYPITRKTCNPPLLEIKKF